MKQIGDGACTTTRTLDTEWLNIKSAFNRHITVLFIFLIRVYSLTKTSPDSYIFPEGDSHYIYVQTQSFGIFGLNQTLLQQTLPEDASFVQHQTCLQTTGNCSSNPEETLKGNMQCIYMESIDTVSLHTLYMAAFKPFCSKGMHNN